MSSSPVFLSRRQVHLDFHTSEHIPDVAAKFDPEQFAQTFLDAHVDSVTVFAKCHHGMCYYPTQTGTVHPHLGGRDLLGEQIEALQRVGIRAPVYTPVAWEEDVARRYPEWRQLTHEGFFVEAGAVTGANDPGKWKFNNFLHPDYQDYLEAHVRELLDRYDVDGLFFDLLVFGPGACWSDASVRFREKHGFLGTDAGTFDRFQAAAQKEFAQRFTGLLHGRQPKATIFYNAGNDQTVEASAGPRARMKFQTHAEIESLPSGIWGYHHFLRTARAIAHWGKPWLGQTGRFQKMWGDFGGYKPVPALEYECFRTQAYGGACLVGDQLHPLGMTDPATYRLIGEVYRQCAAAEAFYKGTHALPQIGIVTAHSLGADAVRTAKSDEGAFQLADESHYDAMMLDQDSDLAGLDLVVLPDSVVVTPKLARKLAAFHRRGGCLLLSADSGYAAAGKWALPPMAFAAAVSKAAGKPVYWRARADFDPDMAQADRVIYERGRDVHAGRGATVLIDRVLPYFDRTDSHFCSHFQTPPQPSADRLPSLLAGDSWAYFADPVFREYRQSANQAVKSAWQAVMTRLVGPPSIGAGLPGSVLVVPRRWNDNLRLTLLRYVPVRRSVDVDVIDERGSFAGETLRLPEQVKHVVDFEDGEALRIPGGGCFALPPKHGRLLLEVPGYFANRRNQKIVPTPSASERRAPML